MIQLLSDPTEAVRIITDGVRLSVFLKIELHRVLELELEHISNDSKIF